MSRVVKGVGNMTASEIMENYKKMNIDVRKMPPYQGAEKFAQQFKRCSITKDVFCLLYTSDAADEL